MADATADRQEADLGPSDLAKECLRLRQQVGVVEEPWQRIHDL
jgi:hypothetical protein